MDKDQDPAAVLDMLLALLPKLAAQSLEDAQAAPNAETARFHLGRRDAHIFINDWIQKADVPPSAEPAPIAPCQQRGITPPQADPGETRLTAATADLTAARARLTNAQAEKLELENAKMRPAGPYCDPLVSCLRGALDRIRATAREFPPKDSQAVRLKTIALIAERALTAE